MVLSCMRFALLVLPCTAARLIQPRRAFLAGSSASLLPVMRRGDAAVAAPSKAASPAAAKQQILAGYDELGRLLRDFEAVVSGGGGDGVRRVLGTVGTTSPVYLIEPAFRLLFDADESLPMEYIETVESLMRNLAAADSEAYSAIFIEFSSAKGKPADYFGRSKQAVARARDDWRQLMDYLSM